MKPSLPTNQKRVRIRPPLANQRPFFQHLIYLEMVSVAAMGSQDSAQKLWAQQGQRVEFVIDVQNLMLYRLGVSLRIADAKPVSVRPL